VVVVRWFCVVVVFGWLFCRQTALCCGTGVLPCINTHTSFNNLDSNKTNKKRGNRFLFGYDEAMDPELQRVFNLAVSRGVNLFDTADSYGTGRLNGRSEQLLGRFVREYPGSESVRDNIHIATKLAAYPWRVTPGNMVAACRGSLRRLEMPALSLGQLHWSAAKYAPLQEWALWCVPCCCVFVLFCLMGCGVEKGTLHYIFHHCQHTLKKHNAPPKPQTKRNGLADCYEQGLVRAVGVSNYGPKQLRKVARQFGSRGVPLASAQVQFSLLSCGPTQDELLETAAELGITVIAYSPLALGLIGGKYVDVDGPLPAGPRGALFRRLLPEVQPLLGALAAVAKSRRKTMSQVGVVLCVACTGS
jgi:pyridoxine 4-dehydrogenase